MSFVFMNYTPQSQSEYQRLYDTCIINSGKYRSVDAAMTKMLDNRDRYEAVGNPLHIPWYFIGIIHSLESTSHFGTHLHNGDSLKRRTAHVPAGRPKTGQPPFAWEYSATDALVMKKLDQWPDWSVPGILFKLEQYNGFGYRSLDHPILSPYLWSYSSHYVKGKFTGDGLYSPNAVSAQCGGAVLLRRLAEKEHIIPVIDRQRILTLLGAEVSYSPTGFSVKALELQRLINLLGIALRMDGKAGPITSNAFHTLTDAYLNGDPRG